VLFTSGRITCIYTHTNGKDFCFLRSPQNSQRMRRPKRKREICKLGLHVCRRWTSKWFQYSVIPRWVPFSPEFRVEQHGVHTLMVYLLTAKTRVESVKTVSLSRQELCGALVLVELAEIILPSMSVLTSELHCWTDSSKPSRLASVRRLLPTGWQRSPQGQPSGQTFNPNTIQQISLVGESPFRTWSITLFGGNYHPGYRLT